ncbi:MAG: BLUF domain-containing protein [Candidatus Competibacteraceae bacterium]|nr:BLUF domain-containing protein [Candidatus Competibacteraceae bacterium]
MIHLIYVSSATHEMSEEDLLFLLKQARDRNKRQDVTGMLLYAGGNFFQVLEGEDKDVEEIYEAILRDERNTGNIVIVKEDINERTFPFWSMGFKHLTRQNKKLINGYSEFLDRKMEPEEFANKSNVIINLLYQFKKGNV